MQILILGMHRSGTSTVARLLNMMGASVGSAELLGPPADDNPKGFWERMDVRDLNDALLSLRGSTWDDPWSFPPGADDFVVGADLQKRISNVVYRLDAQRPWMLKDPRLCLTLAHWLPLLEVPVAVIVLRDPREVAASLAARNAIPTALGLALWEHYTLSALRLSAGVPRVWIEYGDLLADSEAAITTLHARLEASGCIGLRVPSRRELHAFIQPGLRHHRAPDSSTLSNVHPAVSRYHALVAGDASACAGEWTISDESRGLLQWASEARRTTGLAALEREEQLKTELTSSNAKLEERERAAAMRITDLERSVMQLRRGASDADHAANAAMLELRAREAELERTTQLAQSAQEEVRALQVQLARMGEEMKQERARGATLLQRCDRQQQDAQREAERRRATVSQLSTAHEALAADAQQLQRWLDEALVLARASFDSARWRVGHALVRAIEVITLRGRPRLARDHIDQVDRSFRMWRNASVDRRALVHYLHGALLDAGFEGVIPAAVPTSRSSSAIPPRAAPNANDVLCFPVIDWHFRVQRPQHIARVLGARGHRVLYLCTQPETGCEANGYEVIESPETNVWIVRLRVTLAKVPNLYQDSLEGTALDCYREALDAIREAFCLVAPVAVVDLPFWRPLVESLPGATMIYDCMDHHAGFTTNTERMLCEEARLLRNADAVVVTSRWLEQRIGNERPVELIRNGADTKRFEATNEPRSPQERRPVVGYIGAISDWFDIELLAQCARALPEVDFVLVGDVTHPDVRAASALPNVQFIGEVPYSEAPARVHAFDVCTIPFLINELTLATNPVKAYEYLAAGKPVVATAMPELFEMDGLVSIAKDHQTYIDLLRRALASCGDAGAAEQRKRWAQQHDWLQRAQDFELVIRRQQPRASVIVLAWNNLEYTRACLESLESGTDYADWELILVDNASNDGTPDYFREYAATRPHVKLVLNDENLGFAAGNNAGIRASTGEVVVLLNNDTYVTPGWLSGLVGHLRRNPALGIVGPVTNNIGNEARIDVSYGDMQQMRTVTRRWTARHPRMLTASRVVAFFCCAIPRDVIEKVGLLDEAFGQGFFEDDDYCQRIQAIGREVAIADDIFVHHHLSASFSLLREERRRELFECNRAIYERKWGRWTPHGYRAGTA